MMSHMTPVLYALRGLCRYLGPAGVVLGLVSCAADKKDLNTLSNYQEGEPQTAPSGLSPFSCVEDGQSSLLSKIVPAVPVDYLEFREQKDFFGKACKTAKDPQKCNGNLETLRMAEPRGLLATRGDEVFSVPREKLKDFLGKIDAPQEAALVAFFTGDYNVCDGQTQVGVTPNGFLISLPGGCGNDSHQVEVTAEGDLHIIHYAEPCRNSANP